MPFKYHKYLWIFILLFMLSACGQPRAKYIFLFIGDGMGTIQMNAAERYLAAMEGKCGIVPLAMNQAPVHGMITTYSANRYITDSAAGITAILCGQKTTNGTLNMDAEHRYPLKTVSEAARERGMKIGIISTVGIDHATPAGMYAHQPKRSNYADIALQLAYSGFDYFAGADFQATGNERDSIISLVKRNGLIYVNNATAFHYLEPGAGRVLFVHPDSNHEKALPYSMDRDAHSITLSQMLEKALLMLEGPEGFFILIEGGKIDWACHGNDAAASIHETLALDEAVKTALAFYEKNPKNTLILITADHETGGMSMGTNYGDNLVDLSKLQWQKASFTELIREYRDIREYNIEKNGRDSLMKNPDWAFEFAREYTGLGDPDKGLAINEYEKKHLLEAYEQSFKERNWSDPYEYILYGGYDPFMMAVSRTLSRKAGIGWTTYSHTGAPVPVRVFGTGSELFGTFYDNTGIAERLLKILR
ncbi:MAG: alkaline phosphatase [Candidatus Marinimicrobia bacterium]|nr:alkaline phosphatase [Candidatus Neomarinimicrobiota bacterium]